MWPQKSNPDVGIFIKEQVDSLKKKYPELLFDTYIIKGSEGKLNYLKSIFDLRKLLKQKLYNIVHIHYGLSAMFLLFLGKKLLSKSSFMLTLHGSDIMPQAGKYLQQKISLMASKRSDMVIAVSYSMQGILQRNNIKHENIPCGVDTVVFDIHNHDRAGLNNKNIVVFPSRPGNKVKNYSLFLGVMDIVSKTFKNLQVETIENMNRQEVAELLNRAKCLVMTSISEGSPQVVKEALMTGLPVVSVNVGEVNKILKGLPNCYISKHYNSDEIAGYVNVILNTDINRSELRNTFMRKGYDQSSICKKIYCIYKNLAKTKAEQMTNT